MKKQMLFAVALLSTAQVMQAGFGDWFTFGGRESMKAAKQVGQVAMDDLARKQAEEAARLAAISSFVQLIENAVNSGSYDEMCNKINAIPSDIHNEVIEKCADSINVFTANAQTAIKQAEEAAKLAAQEAKLVNRAVKAFGFAKNSLVAGCSAAKQWAQSQVVSFAKTQYQNVVDIKDSATIASKAALENAQNFYTTVAARSAEDNAYHAVKAIKANPMTQAVQANPLGTLAGAVIGNQMFKETKTIATIAGATLGNMYLDTTPKVVFATFGCAAVCVLAKFATTEQVRDHKGWSEQYAQYLEKQELVEDKSVITEEPVRYTEAELTDLEVAEMAKRKAFQDEGQNALRVMDVAEAETIMLNGDEFGQFVSAAPVEADLRWL